MRHIKHQKDQQYINNKGQLTVLTLALSGALAAMTAITPGAVQAQQIVSSSTQAFSWSSSNVTVTSSGTIASTGNTAALQTSNTVGTLSNSGLISSAGGIGFQNDGGTVSAVLNNSSGTISGNTVGISNSGSIGSVINDGGSISSAYQGSIASGIVNSGTITSLSNLNGATITGIFGIRNQGVITTLNNSANILGHTGIYIDHGTVGTLNNSGTINGYLGAPYYGNTGVKLDQGSITSLTNNNLITGYYIGVENLGGTIDSLLNTIGATISGTYFSGVLNLGGTIGVLTNHGLINGGAIGVDNTRGTAATSSQHGLIGSLINTGTIAGVVDGVFNDGTINTLNNSGTITASNGYGVENQGTLSTLTNSGVIVGGTISGTTNGIAVYNNGGTIGTLSNSGTLGGYYDGILNTGTIGTLDNTGTIVSSNTGFGIQNTGTIRTLSNSGLINAGTGIYSNIGSISTLNNAGTIISANVGILNLLASIDTLSNSGHITGALGVYNDSGTIGTLSNTGSIAGSYIFDAASTSGLTSSNTVYSGAVVNMAVLNTLSNLGTLYNTVTIDNTGSGTVVSGAIVNAGTLTSLSNYGLISSNGSVSVTNGYTGAYISSAIANTGTIGTIFNTIGGTISSVNDYGANGPAGYVIQNDGVINVLNNAGLISGYTALYTGPNGSLGTLINTGTIAGDIANNSSTALRINGGSGSIFGTLTGYGGTIGNITTYSSDVIFASGNQVLNDNIVVNSGSGTVTNNGVLQVNNVLSVTGNYYQGAGASLIFGVTSNPNTNTGDLNDVGYGRLVISGDAVLAAGSSISLKSLGYAFAQGQRYVVLASGGTITGATGVTYSATGYSVTGSIQGDTSSSGYSDLVLTLGGTTGNSAINNASSSNATSSLRGLFNYSGTDSSLLAVFNPAAALDDPGSANKAGDQLSPGSVRGAANQAAGASNQAVNNVANDRMDSTRVAQNGGSGLATGESIHDIALWGQIFGGRAAQGERDSVSGYHANFRGSLIGADGLVNDVLRVGGLVSVSKTSVASDGNNTGSSAGINSYGLTAYATYDGAPWYVNLQAGVARQQFSTVRNISYTGFSGTAYGDFNGTQYLTSVQAGYPLNLDAWLPGATLTPIAGLSYSNLRQDAYTESGGSGAALTVNASSSSSLKSELGAKLETSVDTSYGKLLPSVQASWRHEYKDGVTQTGASFAADSTGSTAFVAQSATPVANVGVLNLGVTLLRSANLTLSGKYTLEAGGGYIGQTASVLLRWRY